VAAPLLIALVPGALALAALLLALDAWLRQSGSLPHRAYAAYRAWFLERAEYLIDRTPVRTHALRHGGIAVAAGLLVGLVSGDLVIGIAAFAIGLWTPFLLYNQRVQTRREQLQQQIDPALQFIANTLQITPNLEDALQLVAEHFKAPMSEEAARVVAAYRLGQSLDDALQGMATRCNDPFMTSMVIALVVGRRTGGNVASTLRRIAHATREAVRVELELSSKTRGQRNQFYLVVLLYPLGLLALRSAIPEAWVQLTTTFSGKTCLAMTATVVAVAIYWAQRILSPENL
jgi:tight adherence protein B